MHHIGYILTAAALLPAINQIRHSLRRSSVDGVSGATTWAWVCSWSVWVLYGFMVSDAAFALRNIVGLIPAAVMLFVFVHLATLRGWAPIALLYTAAAAVMLRDLTAGVWLVVSLDVFFYLPGVLAVLRTREPKGVSFSATVGQIVFTGTWLIYLCATGKALAGIGWFIGFCCAIVVAYKVLAYRRRPVYLLHMKSPAPLQSFASPGAVLSPNPV